MDKKIKKTYMYVVYDKVDDEAYLFHDLKSAEKEAINYMKDETLLHVNKYFIAKLEVIRTVERKVKINIIKQT